MQIARTGYLAAYSLIPDATFAAPVKPRTTSAQGSQFYSEWWQIGAPRPMKMGNIASPWRYDAGA